MIITTNNLNNIETKITTPQIEGIEFIDTVLTGSEAIAGINASYNDIISIIDAGKLPIIVYNNSNGKEFMFIFNIFFNDSYYIVELIDGSKFKAENTTTNMVIIVEEI